MTTEITSATPLTKFQPPADVQAEAAILGAMLYDQRHVSTLPAALRPESFFSESHRQIFAAVDELRTEKVDVTTATVEARLRARKQVRKLQDGADYLNRLVDDTQILTPNAFGQLVKIVIDKATARAASILFQRAVAQIHGEGDVHALLASVEAEIQKLAMTAQTGGLHHIKPALRRTLTEWHERHAGRGSQGLSTGFKTLDGTLRYKRGTLQIVAGRPGMGKTSYLAACTEKAASSGEEVAIFSLEMIEDDMAARLICNDAGLSIVATETRPLTPTELQNASIAVDRLEQLPIYIDDAAHGRLTAAEIIARMRRWAAELKRKGKSARLAFVDFAGMVKRNPKLSNERNDIMVGEVATDLKSAAKELDITVVLLSQINRGVESRTDKRPVGSDLKDSGTLEEAADAIVFLYRDEFYTRENSRDPGTCEVIVDKNRYGPTGMVKLAFHGPTTKFSDLSTDPDRPSDDGQPYEREER